MPAVDKIGILVEALSAQAVILHKFQPVILARSAPPSENRRSITRECAAMSIREFEVFLDADPPTVMQQSGGHGFPFKVTVSDPEFFFLEVFRFFGEVVWQLEIFWTHAGHHGSTMIDQNGQPFRHTADATPLPGNQVHDRLRKFLHAVPCPTCGREPASDRDYCTHREILADTWLHPDFDNPGQVIGRHHCFGCKPRETHGVVRCVGLDRVVGVSRPTMTSCAETICITEPLLSRNGPDERVLNWLYDHGWHGKYPYGLTCKDHAPSST